MEDGEDAVVGVDEDADILAFDAGEVEVLEEVADEAGALHAFGTEAVAGVPGTR